MLKGQAGGKRAVEMFKRTGRVQYFGGICDFFIEKIDVFGALLDFWVKFENFSQLDFL